MFLIQSILQKTLKEFGHTSTILTMYRNSVGFIKFAGKEF